MAEPGFPPAEALRRLRAARGLEPGRAAPEDPETLLEDLEPAGLLGRWTRLEPGAVSGLSLPTLARFEEGRCRLLRAGPRGALETEGPDGNRPLDPALPEAYLDLAPALRPGGLWRAAGALLLAEGRALPPLAAAALLIQGLALLTPWLTRILVDQVFPRGALSLFQVVLAANLGAGGFLALIGWLRARAALFLEVRLGFLVEQGLTAHLLRLPLPRLQERGLGGLLQGLHGLHAAKDLLGGHLLATLLDAATALACLALMAALLPGATLALAAATLLAAGVAASTGWGLARVQAQAAAAGIRERGFLAELLRGVVCIKACGAEAQVEDRWAALLARRRALELVGQRLGLAGSAAAGLVQAITAQALMLWGAHQALQGRISLGDLLAFALMAAAFQGAAAGLASLALQGAAARPQLAVAQDLLALAPEPPPGDPGPRRGPVRVQRLAFRYGPGLPWVLRDLDLEVPAGDRVVLRGPSGCGKSTLLRILAGLYTPVRGRIDLGGAAPAQARRWIAYLPQGVRLFQGSILENLHVLSGGAARTHLMAAAEATGLDDLTATLPMGYDTWVAPGGANLSGGQRQVLALTAILASGRDLLLLDEPMAHLDAAARERICAGPAFQGRTVLMASHEDPEGARGPEAHGFRPQHLPGPAAPGLALPE